MDLLSLSLHLLSPSPLSISLPCALLSARGVRPALKLHQPSSACDLSSLIHHPSSNISYSVIVLQTCLQTQPTMVFYQCHQRETHIPVRPYGIRQNRKYSKSGADRVIRNVESRDALVIHLLKLWKYWKHDNPPPDNYPPFNEIADAIGRNSGLKQLRIDLISHYLNEDIPDDVADYFYRSVANITSLERLQLARSVDIETRYFHSVLPQNLKHLSILIDNDNPGESQDPTNPHPFISLMEHNTLESLHIKDMGGKELEALVAAISKIESTLRLRSFIMERCRLTGKAIEILANWFIQDHCKLEKLHLIRITRHYCNCDYCAQVSLFSVDGFKCPQFNSKYKGDGMPLENLFYFGTKGDLTHIIFDDVDASIWDTPSFCEHGPLERVTAFEMSSQQSIVFSQDERDAFIASSKDWENLHDIPIHHSDWEAEYERLSKYTLCYPKFLQKHIPAESID